jgi:hypothetical protein
MIPINHGVRDKEKVEACKAIFSAQTIDQQQRALNHWSSFVPYAMPDMMAEEFDVEHIERVYEILYNRANQWYTNYRLLALEARLESLENPEAVRP